ncbi:MAG: hypothetical protein QOE59_914 [Actinomycetota bacterium]|jgi:hypothetical protein|nr:hypothetical protein [Actinomycetota bacterium]
MIRRSADHDARRRPARPSGQPDIVVIDVMGE